MPNQPLPRPPTHTALPPASRPNWESLPPATRDRVTRLLALILRACLDRRRAAAAEEAGHER
jgi:hypothetical protein